MFRIKVKAIFVLVVMLLTQIISTAPVRAATTISITSPTSNSTVTGDSFTVAGTATANRKVTVKVNGVSVGSTTSNGSGAWSLDATGQSSGPKTIEATATGQLVFANVISTNPGSPYQQSRMSKINTLTNTEEGSFSTYAAGATFINWKANPAFTKAYGVAPYLNSPTVWVMDFATGAVTTFSLPGSGQRGASIAYNTDGSKVYITDNANTDVIVYDTTTNAQIGSAIGIGDSPHSNFHRPGTNEIWIDESSSSSLAVIDATTDTLIHTYAIAGSPNGLTFSPDGETAYVGLTNSLAVVDADTGTTTNVITGTDTPEYLAINNDGTKVYASHPGTTTVDVFNTVSETLEDTITGLPTGTWGLALTADDSRLYVTSPNLFAGLTGTTISVIDTSNNNIVDTIIPGDGAPFYISAAPPESDSDTVNITLNAGSSVTTLADTGINRSHIALLAMTLIVVGLVGAFMSKRRKQQTTSSHR